MQPCRFYADAKRVGTVTDALHPGKKLYRSGAYINFWLPTLHAFMLM